MQSACEGFRWSGGQVKRELADKWLKANQKLNCLPEGRLPHEVYPYSVNPVAKPGQQMKARIGVKRSFTTLTRISILIYPILRPVLGLVVLVNCFKSYQYPQ